MSIRDFVPQIPYGTKDFLPEEAQRKRLVETTLNSLFMRWGYDEVTTPTYEYLDTFTNFLGSDSPANVFKFFDINNRTLTLRSDMTTPIARLAASRLKNASTPLRLYYIANVFRYEQTSQAGRQCEFGQGGIELLGVPEPSADAEVVALAIEAMLEIGLPHFNISLGQVAFINGIMQELGIDEKTINDLKHLMITRDLVGLERKLENSGLDLASQKIIKEIPLLYGGEEILLKAKKMVTNSVSQQAIDNLSEVYELLKSYHSTEFINFDLGLIRDFNYYTGLVFEGYTKGLGFPILGGGRYDNLVSAFGRDCPATGFALGIDRILLAFDRQKIQLSNTVKDIYIAWETGSQSLAISEAHRLRKTGKTVELGLTPQSEEQARLYAQEKGYAETIYIKKEI